MADQQNEEPESDYIREMREYEEQREKLLHE